MESLCHVDIILFQQVLTGKPKHEDAPATGRRRTRRRWYRQRHRSKLVACPIGRAQALQKGTDRKGNPSTERRGQTEKATPVPKSICRGILHGHSMTTGNYCIYGMNFSFPVSHPARLPLTTEIARWSTIGPSPDRRNNTEPTCPLLDPVCLIWSVEASFGHSVGCKVRRSPTLTRCNTHIKKHNS